ncbi:MAG: hypothetical protein AVDCRST_MAG34-1440, partial [uncultured Nocardioidaceae bacterium]
DHRRAHAALPATRRAGRGPAHRLPAHGRVRGPPRHGGRPEQGAHHQRRRGRGGPGGGAVCHRGLQPHLGLRRRRRAGPRPVRGRGRSL